MIVPQLKAPVALEDHLQGSRQASVQLVLFGGTGASAKLMMPSFVPVQAATPDLPATAAGLDPAFVSYPRNLVKSVPRTPGSSRDVNKDLNANMKMVMAATPDYRPNLTQPWQAATCLACSIF
jgi:hypothetical protein